MTLRETVRADRAEKRKGLVPFFTAGYPDEETTLRLIAAAAAADCRVIEIGVPFSDPIADGPVIQESSRLALEGGMSLQRVIDLTKRASRATSAAIVLMGYLNPILQMGYDAFARNARDAGVAGVIIPDLPVEESAEIKGTLADCDITLVDLLAPTTNPARISRIAAQADGFLYLVSLTGVTGSQSVSTNGLGEFVARVRSCSDLPLYVGFGISTPADARRTVEHADGVIIGSALIRIIQSSPDTDEAVGKVAGFLESIQQAINTPTRGRMP